MPILLVLLLAILTMHHINFLSFPMLILSFCCWSEIRNVYASFFKLWREATILESNSFFQLLYIKRQSINLNHGKGELGQNHCQTVVIPVNQMKNIYPEICIFNKNVRIWEQGVHKLHRVWPMVFSTESNLADT